MPTSIQQFYAKALRTIEAKFELIKDPEPLGWDRERVFDKAAKLEVRLEQGELRELTRLAAWLLPVVAAYDLEEHWRPNRADEVGPHTVDKELSIVAGFILHQYWLLKRTEADEEVIGKLEELCRCQLATLEVMGYPYSEGAEDREESPQPRDPNC